MEHRGIEISDAKLDEFCKKHRIRKLAFFGSVLRSDFEESHSDIDVLVEFEPGHRVGLIGFARIERELSELLGRKVDLNTADFLSKYYRDEVLKEAQIYYDAAR